MAKKTTLNELGKMLEHIVKHMLTQEDGENFATRVDIAKLEKGLDHRIDGLKVKVDGIQNTLDNEALARTDEKIPERVAKLEAKVFGTARS
jgi:hypothetical protein